jgi:hypothetical protein
MSDLHKSDPDSPYADDLEFVRDYARRNDGYALVQPVVDFINAHPDPQIIRSVEELEALDPDTVVMDGDTTGGLYFVRQYRDADWYEKGVYERYLPAVVIREGAEVRAANKALNKETGNDGLL